ncbi:24984_t:CDS:2 [Cetraspora pellucida]|uniref:24984_t:CDS:1 n=1 Tax=Cetraspora pellucida TaxID=1433469 RepID=A0A9N9HRN2_9GLOM|nr:24984_t:CDS:2 [Cetraspora pellucida]
MTKRRNISAKPKEFKFIDQTLEIIANENLKSSNIINKRISDITMNKVVQTESALETTPQDKKDNKFINNTPDTIRNEHVRKSRHEEQSRSNSFANNNSFENAVSYASFSSPNTTNNVTYSVPLFEGFGTYYDQTYGKMNFLVNYLVDA